jgi:hypothetical protein
MPRLEPLPILTTTPSQTVEDKASYPKSHIYEMPGDPKAAETVYAAQQPTEQEVTQLDEVVVTAPAAPDLNKISPPVTPRVISIVDDYDWTVSVNKAQLIQQVPRIILTEYNITASNVVQSLYAGLMAWSDLRAANAAGVQALGNTAADVTGVKDLTNFLNNKTDGKLSNFLKSVGNSSESVVKSVGEFADKAVNYAKSKFNPQASGFGPGGSNLVNLYGDIYARKSTGNVYMMPYFTSDYISVHNAFADTYEHLDEVRMMTDRVVGEFEKIPSLVEPGVYVQRPKFYMFKSSNTATHELTFNLFNTVTPMAYLSNAAFIQKLALSNMPRRKTRVVVDPPCIYEVLIPGKAFFPYCYIRSMNVKHLGTKRVINGETIPDAYQISIVIESLLAEASNFYEGQMQHHNIAFDNSSINEDVNVLEDPLNQGLYSDTSLDVAGFGPSSSSDDSFLSAKEREQLASGQAQIESNLRDAQIGFEQASKRLAASGNTTEARAVSQLAADVASMRGR